MAKLNGPLGSKLRGKVGEVVAAKTVGGATAIRAYQPVVKNPNTVRQQASRSRFAMASGIVASLAEVMNIGFAKAASAAGIYPRNMAVRYLVGATDVLVQTGLAFDSLVISQMQVSKKAGLDPVPTLRYTAPAGSTPAKITLVNSADFSGYTAGESLGIVVVALSENGDGTVNVMRTYKGDATSGITIPATDQDFLMGCTILGFVKVMPATGNSIPTDQWPWKYPSATSATTFVTTIS